jgi:hypothetical protein
MNGVPAFVGLALLSAFLCMFIASGSAIWSILAPIFVPMFMLLGFHRHLRRFCSHRRLIGARWRRYRRLCRYFSASYSATGPTLNLNLLLAGLALSINIPCRLATAAGWLVPRGAAYRTGYYPRLP